VSATSLSRPVLGFALERSHSRHVAAWEFALTLWDVTQVSDQIPIVEKTDGSVLKSITIYQNDKLTGGTLEPVGEVTLSCVVASPNILKKARLARLAVSFSIREATAYLL
jgi:hypothetical protein